MTMRLFGVITALALLLGGCGERPPFVLLTVEDPEAVAVGADTIAVGTKPAALEPVQLHDPVFPLTIAVTAPAPGERELWVEVRGGAGGNALGRGRTSAVFARRGTPTATVLLAKACAADLDCADEAFCDGTGLCRGGVCVFVAQPCAANFPCVNSTCVEVARQCSISVNHALCPDGHYCDPGSGCTEGPRCLVENDGADCQDGVVCNGIEACINYHCVGGAPPPVDDGDECTVDGCNDAQSPAIFHVPLPARDGNACFIPGSGAAGVCVSGKGGCAVSECGDGVVDSAAGEVCDDGASNSDAWQVAPHCNVACSGLAPFCGDNRIEAGHETCDDGASFDSGNGCSDQCQRNDGGCGDGVAQSLFEECDDQDADNCDGCRDDCRVGCICAAPGACLGANWCVQGACVACDDTAHCGPRCEVCEGETPLCGGAAVGCTCDPTPAPRGSCGRGAYCAGGGCAPCADAQHCGQECVACDGDTPVCGGVEVGCVVDPALDPASGGCAGMPDFTRCRVATPAFSYDICVAGLCVEPGCGDPTCSPRAPSFAQADVAGGARLPDTLQRTCYNASGTMTCASSFPCAANGGPNYCGQDAQYGWDVTHAPSERFTRIEEIPGEPRVIDNVTALDWQGCAGGLQGTTCATGLPIQLPWAQALARCDGLVWGGYADWRLPDVHEFGSIIDNGRTEPSTDPDAFPGFPGGYFWTSTSWPSGSGLVYDGNLNFGAISYTPPTTAGRNAICVRTRASSLGAEPRFTRSEPISGEPVVVDARTALMWQGCLGGQTGTACAGGTVSLVSWRDALAYCEGLTWAGVSAWRLPDVNELFSLADVRWHTPAIDGAAFPEASAADHWSATTHASTGFTSARTISYAFGGYRAASDKGELRGARCVRSMP